MKTVTRLRSEKMWCLRCADAIEKVTTKRPELLEPFKKNGIESPLKD
jgi:hypothetical protein